MFTMRICNVETVLVAHGDSQQDEDWTRTLIRLLRGALPPGSPLPQVIHARLLDGRPGEARAVVYASFTDGVGNVHCDLALTVHTHPLVPGTHRTTASTTEGRTMASQGPGGGTDRPSGTSNQ